MYGSKLRQLTCGTRQAGGARLAAATCHSSGARQASSAGVPATAR